MDFSASIVKSNQDILFGHTYSCKPALLGKNSSATIKINLQNIYFRINGLSSVNVLPLSCGGIHFCLRV